jgi:hypothetical protein
MEGRAPRAVILAIIALPAALACGEAAAQPRPERSDCTRMVGPSGQVHEVCEPRSRPQPRTVPSRPAEPSPGTAYRNGSGGFGRDGATVPRRPGAYYRYERPGTAGPPPVRSSPPSVVRSGRPGSGLVPVRALAEPAEMPPRGVGAYGVVAFVTMPLPHQVRRHRAVCEAFKATLIPQERVARDTPLSSQMITFWPIADKSTPEARQLDCAHLIGHYDLKTGLDAVRDADRDGDRLAARQGPFLIAWSPAESRFQKDTVVLVFDLSNLDSEQSFLEVFQDWRQKIVDDPSLWRRGFDVQSVRRQLRDTLDRYGEGILKLIKL